MVNTIVNVIIDIIVDGTILFRFRHFLFKIMLVIATFNSFI